VHYISLTSRRDLRQLSTSQPVRHKSRKTCFHSVSSRGSGLPWHCSEKPHWWWVFGRRLHTTTERI